MSTVPTAPAPTTPAPVPAVWKLLLVVPALLHFGFFLWSANDAESSKVLHFTAIDLAVHLIVFGHLCLVILAAHSRQLTFWLLILTCGGLLGLVVADRIADARVPAPPKMLPRFPMSITATTGAALGEQGGATYTFTVNSLGLRGPEMNFAQAHVKILCLGSGTTECPYVTDEESWPWALQDRLQSDLERTVFVGNAGKRNYTIVNFEAILRDYLPSDEKESSPVPQFDWVVLQPGFNDWRNTLTLDEVAKVQEVIELPFPPTFVVLDDSPLYYRQTALFRFIKRFRTEPDDPTGVWVSQGRQQRANMIANSQVLSKSQLTEDLPKMLEVYRANLKALHAACRARGCKLLLLTQPTLYQTRLTLRYHNLLWRVDNEWEAAPSVAYLEELNTRYNQVLVEFCQQAKVDYIDLMELVRKDPSLLLDDCHLNARGCDQVAERLATFFKSKLK